MKKIVILFVLAFSTFFTIRAQSNDRFVYLITDQQAQGTSWSFLRKLNLQTGVTSEVLLNGNDLKAIAIDATTKKPFENPLTDSRMGSWANAPFGTGVAAMAYDPRNKRLYYTPMFLDQLRYIDLKTMKVYYMTDQVLTARPEKLADQSNVVTRMVIASDGNGYAMTNDATQLIRFTTGKKINITNLGVVIDDQANKDISIHHSCSSYGGDMIADDNGNLFVFSAMNQVYKIKIDTKVATHLGTIQGLPSGFTVNGAAVMEDNRVLVASAISGAGYYTVDLTTLKASAYAISGTIWQSSDLANGNLFQNKDRKTTALVATVEQNKEVPKEKTKINIYPNPATENQFVIQFSDLNQGGYIVIVADMNGRQVYKQALVQNGKVQQHTILLDPATPKGVYLVNVLDSSNKSISSTKLVLQ